MQILLPLNDAVKASDAARAGELAKGLDALTEEELLVFADIQASTALAWRKRGIGPKYVRLGNRYFYPRAELAEYLRQQAQRQTTRRGRRTAGDGAQ